jgi:hypothetical protein
MRAAKVDRNQPEIVAALRAAGCSVQTLHRVGQGCPDLLVGTSRRNLLIEVKAKAQSWAKALTPDQIDWHINWRGQVAVVNSVEEALALVAEEATA